MVKRTGGKDPKEREPLAPVTVGSGITEYSRLPSVFDSPYRDPALRGALVDSRVRRTPAPLMQEFRSEVEQFCREKFADAGLPDPYSLIHPEGRFPSLDGKWVMAKGLDYLKSRFALGYQLEAIYYLLSMSPSEDHTELWYAARLAAEFTTLDILVAKLRTNDGTPEELLMYAAQTGAELGRLDKEHKLKFGHETDALRGKDTLVAAASGGRERAKAKRDENRDVFAEMDRRVARGERIAHAARQAVRKFRMSIKADSLARSYLRHLKRRM